MEERDIHRIGGGSVENLRLKPTDARLNPPGISVLQAATPAEAAQQIREAFPEGTDLCRAASTVGSTNTAKIREAGFEIIPKPSRRLPNHYRIIHQDGTAGFNDENLKQLAEAFTNVTEQS
jgi:hypothetical protein